MAAIFNHRHRQRMAAKQVPNLRNLFIAQNGLCFYCKCQMQMFISDETEATRDHRTPISRGGAMRGRNVVAACNGCNHLKGEMTEAEFRLVMEIIRNLLKLG